MIQTNTGNHRAITKILLLFAGIGMVFGLTPFDPDHSGYVEGFLTLSHEHLEFGEVTTGETESSFLTIHNGGDENLAFLDYMATQGPFTASDNPTLILPHTSVDVGIIFAPSQNVNYLNFLYISLTNTDTELLVSLTGSGIYEDNYYNSTQNLWGEDLKTALSNLIDGHNDLGYNTARDRMFDTIDNVDGTIEGVYSGIIIEAENRTQAQAQGFDTEHTWPKSLGALNSPPKSDLHHLYPTRSQFNSTRGNLPFGNVINSNWPSGVPNSSDTDRGYDVNNVQVFEPRDIHKGDVARSMFYFCLRYDNPYDFLDYQEDVLRDWFYQDFVSTKEIERNQAIYGYQNNRSPFVDHPEFLERISSLSGYSPSPAETANIVLPPGPVNLFSWQDTQTFTVGNEGAAILNITDVQFTNAMYSASLADSQLFPGETSTIELSQVFDIGGVYDCLLIVSSNDPDNPVEMVAVTFYNVPGGDVTLDDAVDVLDIVQIVSFIFDDVDWTIAEFILADVTADFAVDVLDIVILVDWIIS